VRFQQHPSNSNRNSPTVNFPLLPKTKKKKKTNKYNRIRIGHCALVFALYFTVSHAPTGRHPQPFTYPK